MADPDQTSWSKNELPYNWDPARAMPFFEAAKTLDKFLRSDLPIKREVMLVIFFHETGFANVRQAQGTGPAVGFGQMEIFNLDKIPFFEKLRFNSAILNPKVSALSKKKYRHLRRCFR